MVDVQHPWPYRDQRYNENLSPRIPRALGRETGVYGRQDSYRHPGAYPTDYSAAFADVPSLQLTIRPGWTISPDQAAALVGQLPRTANPRKQRGIALPRLPWQVR